MNLVRLKEAEERFFMRYPGGFSNPLMLEVAKRHKVEKMNKLAVESFSIEQFENPDKIVDSINKIIGQASMVSLFEKPKFRDAVKTMSENEKEYLSNGLKEFLYGNQGFGFELMCGLLNQYHLAKWTLLTICPVYYKQSEEVFIKPTTTKDIINYFELEGLKYSPTPTYEFYRAYRDQINTMKMQVDASLHSDNAAFCGFLMISMRKD